MKIPPSEIDKYIADGLKNTVAVLIYGPDNGLIKERVKACSLVICKELNDPFKVIDFNYEKIKDSLASLNDAIYSLSFTRERKVIRVNNAPTSLPQPIQEALNNYQGTNLTIFSTNDLSPSSSTRKFFETSKNCAAIACYKDEQATIKRLIVSELKQQGLAIEEDALRFLETSLAGDRMLILSEIEKLITYMGKERLVKLADVKQSLGSITQVSLDDLCMQIASFNKEKSLFLLNNLLAEGISTIAILRALSRYFMRLHQVKMELSKGTPENQAMAILSPPVFFKNVPIFLQHLKLWSISSLTATLKTLLRLEAECKKTGVPAELICDNIILKITATKGTSYTI